MTISRNSILIGATVLLIGGFWALPTAQSLYNAVHLFDEDRIVENFRTADQLGAISTMSASSDPRPYSQGTAIELPEEFSYAGQPLIFRSCPLWWRW